MSLVDDLPEDEQDIFKALLGPGFKDTTRISASSPDWGVDVCRNNISNVMVLLDKFEENITLFKDKLSVDNSALKHFFEQMREMKRFLN